MEYLDLVRKNRSYRGFDSTFTVSRKTLESLVEFARLAPSSVNLQPLKYFLSYTNATNAAIQPLTAWARRLQPLQLPKPGQYPTAFIVILQDLSISENIDRFAKYLRNFDGIQFALVTHQKATMEHADVLYGVTMPEQGVSKVLSLRLGDDFEL